MPDPAPPRRRGRPPEGAREAILATTLELIDERGFARVTTKEIARRAGVSEASIYYHFADKPALVEGVILEAVLGPLKEFASEFERRSATLSVDQALLAYARALQSFWDGVLPVLSAVQADLELRSRFRQRINALGLGPHRGVNLIKSYLDRQREAGAVRADADTRGAALLLTGACHLTAYQRHMLGPAAGRKLPSVDTAVAALVSLLTPPRD